MPKNANDQLRHRVNAKVNRTSITGWKNFNTLQGHEKKYHPTIHPDEKTIMEDYSSDQTEN